MKGRSKMKNDNREELVQILVKFAESGWDLIAGPSKAWLDRNEDVKELLAAIEQADKDCGSCGCEYDPLYKRAIELLRTA
jgi:sugar phosphate isomerase/epimerase